MPHKANLSVQFALQQAEAKKAEAEAGESTSYSSEAPEGEGSLASDEALQALRDKLTGGN